VIIEDAPALMHKSKIKCAKGGVISIQKHNQCLESDGAVVLPVKAKPIEAPKEQKKESINDFWSNRKTWVHPLKGGPTLDPTTGGRNFGAPRKNRDKDGRIRYHAGIDFVAEPGREVIAMTDGVVIRISYDFYAGTDAVEVKHSDGTIGRYCEIKVSVKQNDKVKKGDVLGKIITSEEETHMLHLEVYDGTGEGFLTQDNWQNYKNVPIRNYQRRCDLVDPTGAKDLKVIQ
jgi:murein DD-endopeptidase MepM/ murein hydrolase activator NlpD